MVNHQQFCLHPLDDVIPGEEREFDNTEQVLALFSVCVCVWINVHKQTTSIVGRINIRGL